MKLIYNTHQKTKRYAACETTYQTLTDELATIETRMKELTLKKQTISQNYQALAEQMAPTLKGIARQAVGFAKEVVGAYCHMQKITITYQAEKKFTLEKIPLRCFLHRSQRERELIVPRFMLEGELSDQQMWKELAGYGREVEERAEEWKAVSRKMLEFTSNFFKLYDKYWHIGLKDITAGFEKLKKRVGDLMGNRLGSFLKSIHSIFEVTSGINQKMLNQLQAKLRLLEQAVLDEAKITDMCLR